MVRGQSAKKTGCPSCGGDIVESEKTVRTKGAVRTVPLGRCLGCGAEYDRHTAEYYKLFQDYYQLGADDGMLELGLKGELDEQGCEINGRLRLQPEDIDAPSAMDEWQVATEDGSYLWITVEKGRYFFCAPYEPVSFNLDADDHRFEFEGRLVNKRCARRYRVISTSGYLRYSMGIGDGLTVYRFRADGVRFEALVLPGRVLFRKCERLSPADALYLFRQDDYGEIIEKHYDKIRQSAFRVYWYLAMALGCLCFVLWVHSRGSRVMSAAKPAVPLESGAEYLSEGVYSSRFLYGPAALESPGALYRLSVKNTAREEGLSCEWASLRLMLIRAEKLGRIPGPADAMGTAKMRETFNTIDAMKDPLEDLSLRLSLWRMDAKNHKGPYSLRKDIDGLRFVAEGKGNYYLYLESYGARPLPAGALEVDISREAGDTRYPAAAGFLFIALAVYNYKWRYASRALPPGIFSGPGGGL